MKTVLIALLAVGLVLGAVPLAAAHHTGCTEPDLPCNPWPPCDAKCWIAHLKWTLACMTDPAC